MSRVRNFLKVPLNAISERAPQFRFKPTRTTGKGLNLHKSNKAKEGVQYDY